MHWYFHVEVSQRWHFQFIHSLQTERTMLDHHVALFYVCILFRSRYQTLSFITGIDQGYRVEVRRQL